MDDRVKVNFHTCTKLKGPSILDKLKGDIKISILY